MHCHGLAWPCAHTHAHARAHACMHTLARSRTHARAHSHTHTRTHCICNPCMQAPLGWATQTQAHTHALTHTAHATCACRCRWAGRHRHDTLAHTHTPHTQPVRAGAIGLGDYVEAAGITFLFGLAGVPGPCGLHQGGLIRGLRHGASNRAARGGTYVAVCQLARRPPTGSFEPHSLEPPGAIRPWIETPRAGGTGTELSPAQSPGPWSPRPEAAKDFRVWKLETLSHVPRALKP